MNWKNDKQVQLKIKCSSDIKASFKSWSEAFLVGCEEARPLSIDGLQLAMQGLSGVMQELYGLQAVSPVTDARAEEGEHFASRPVLEGVEQAHVVGVVEGHFPLVAV